MLASRRPSLGSELAAAEDAATAADRFLASRSYEQVDVWQIIAADSTSWWEPGWGPADPTAYGPPQFLLDPVGIVHLRGVAWRYSLASFVILHLPYALRPPVQLISWTRSNTGNGLTIVSNDGASTIVQILSGGVAPRFLSGLVWPRVIP